MSWYEYELYRLKEDQKLLKQFTLGLSIFGSIFADWWAVYSTEVFLDMMTWHPYPERILILTLFFIGSALVINGLTVLMFLKYRKRIADE